MIARAAQRWNVSGVLLAAQLHQESGFNPNAVSKAGARGIAQFMPATARGYGLRDPHDPAASIDAQAHLMRDLLRRFGAVPLALAAYNAGPAPVGRCGCVPPYPETQAYVATILALMRGAGFDAVAGPGLEVRLVR
jgi:soluble lytic murein transglycosylase-like protein